VNAETPEDLRSQLERLQESLSTRQSILHFAHTGVSLIAALIFAGAAAKLFWDSQKVPVLGFAATAVALGLALYALVNYLKGRRELAEELKRYGDLLELRRRLHLDNPSTLLPR
jgi:Ni/Fe-hydrogenase subunit HybB-like protein